MRTLTQSLLGMQRIWNQARNYYGQCSRRKSLRKNPHEPIAPKGLRHEVGNVFIPQSLQRNGSETCPDCMQTGMHAKGTLISLKRQRSGLERPQNSVIGFRKTVQTVRNEGKNEEKARTSEASARRVCQTLVEIRKKS